MYIIFGTATTLINWLAYILLLPFLTYEISNAIAWVISVVFAFIVNKIFVFRSRGTGIIKTLREALMFLLARIFSGFIEIAGLPLLVNLGMSQEVFGIENALAKFVTTIVVLILNYIFSKFAIFRKPQKP